MFTIFSVKDECQDLKQQADVAGDDHYRAMTDYMTDGRSPALRERARGFAYRYRRSLTWLMECYARMRDRFTARRKLANAIDMKTLVEKDIEILEETS